MAGDKCQQQQCTTDHGAASERGAALLIVVMTLAALSLIIGSALSSARQSAQAANHRLQRLRQSAAIDGAVATTIHALASAGASRPAILNGPTILKIGNQTVRIEVRPEAGKLDLNTTPPDVLSRFFNLSGLNETLARKLVTQIEKRRGTKHTGKNPARPGAGRELEGAKTAHPFLAVAELRRLDILPPNGFACLAPDLTVFEAGVPVDAAVASPPVRAAFKYEKQPISRINSRTPITGHSVNADEIFDVTARISPARGGERSTRTTILRMTGSDRRPALILAQFSPARDRISEKAACAAMQRASNAAGGVMQ